SLVFIMTPGVGLLYSGMARSKNALSLIMTSMLAMAIITLQWVIFGFSFTFSEGGSPLMGNFQFAGLQNVSEKALSVAPAIPGILFALYQMQFATVTPALIFGSVAERIRLLPA
ncbi:ammonium transporter AmtB-like domain-containing protein, partial [Entophlyctis helioformis]